MFTIAVSVFEKPDGLLVRRTPKRKRVVYLDNQTVRPVAGDFMSISQNNLDLKLKVGKVELAYTVAGFHILVEATEV